MNREIEFRGKSYKDNTWIQGYLTRDLKGHYRIQFDVKCFSVVIKENTLGQFSGLKDVNEVEIYEGDVVDWTFFRYYGTEEEHRLRGIIEWYQGGFIFKVIENDFENAGFYGISDLNTDTESDCEIIGNIYDNPELINKEK